MTAYVQDFIRHAPFMIMATSGEAGHCDASPKGGKPGFVRVLDERHLLVPMWLAINCFNPTKIWRQIRMSDCCFSSLA